MSSVYPGALDTFVNPNTDDRLDDPNHADQHTDANDAIEAIEGTLGVNPAGSQTDVASRLVAMETRVSSLGLGTGPSYSFVGSATAGGADPITLTKPGATADGDLIIIAGAGHNVTLNGPPSGGGWSTIMSYDTDGQEPIYCWVKIASGEASTWTIDTNNASATLSGAVAVVLRGLTTLHRYTVTDAVGYLARPNGHPNGVAIGVWVSALAASPYMSLMQNEHVNYHVAASQPAFMICSAPLTNDEPIPQFDRVTQGTTSSQWMGTLVMIWS